MLLKPKHGWATVKIDYFKDRASYLTDIPNDCLNAFIHALENNTPAVVYFDAEGWDYHLVSSYYNSYIIREKGYLETHYLELNFKNLAKELISDIEENINDWAEWLSYRDFNEVEIADNKRILEDKLTKLKELLVKYN